MTQLIGRLAIVLYPAVSISFQNIRTGKNLQLSNQVQSTLLCYNLSFFHFSSSSDWDGLWRKFNRFRFLFFYHHQI